MKQGLPRVQISMMNVYICVYLTPAGLYHSIQSQWCRAFTTGYSHRVWSTLPLDIVTGPDCGPRISMHTMTLRWLYIVLITSVLLLTIDLMILHLTDWYEPTPTHSIIHTPAYRGSIEI